jgi:hypothetical protein
MGEESEAHGFQQPRRARPANAGVLVIDGAAGLDNALAGPGCRPRRARSTRIATSWPTRRRRCTRRSRRTTRTQVAAQVPRLSQQAGTVRLHAPARGALEVGAGDERRRALARGVQAQNQDADRRAVGGRRSFRARSTKVDRRRHRLSNPTAPSRITKNPVPLWRLS